MTFPVIYPNSSSHASSGMSFLPQYSCVFSQLEHASSLFLVSSHCCTFPSVGCTASPHFLFSFSTTMFGHSHLWCPIPLHLKHCTSSTTSCLPTFSSSLTLHCITLLAIFSNLFWETGFPFTSFIFLQLWTRCPNFLHPVTNFIWTITPEILD